MEQQQLQVPMEVCSLSQTTNIDTPLLHALRMIHDPSINDKVPDFFSAVLRACQDQEALMPSVKEVSPFLPLITPLLLRAISMDCSETSAALVLGYFIHHPLLSHAIEAEEVFKVLLEITFRHNATRKQRTMVAWMIAQQRFQPIHVQPYISQLLDAVISILELNAGPMDQKQAIEALLQLHKQCPVEVIAASTKWIVPLFRFYLHHGGANIEGLQILELADASRLQRNEVLCSQVIALLRARLQSISDDVMLMDTARVALQLFGARLLKDTVIFTGLVSTLTRVLIESTGAGVSTVLIALACWHQLIVSLGPKYVAHPQKGSIHIRKLCQPLQWTCKHSNTRVRIASLRCHIALLNQIPESGDLKEPLWDLLLKPILSFVSSDMDTEGRQLALRVLHDILSFPYEMDIDDQSTSVARDSSQRVILRRLRVEQLFPLDNDGSLLSEVRVQLLSTAENAWRYFLSAHQIGRGSEVVSHDNQLLSSNTFKYDWEAVFRFSEALALFAHRSPNFADAFQRTLKGFMVHHLPQRSLTDDKTDGSTIPEGDVALSLYVALSLSSLASCSRSANVSECLDMALHSVKWLCLPKSSIDPTILTHGDVWEAIRIFLSFLVKSREHSLSAACTKLSSFAQWVGMEGTLAEAQAPPSTASHTFPAMHLLFTVAWRYFTLWVLTGDKLDDDVTSEERKCFMALIISTVWWPHDPWSVYGESSRILLTAFSQSAGVAAPWLACSLSNSELWDKLLSRVLNGPLSLHSISDLLASLERFAPSQCRHPCVYRLFYCLQLHANNSVLVALARSSCDTAAIFDGLAPPLSRVFKTLRSCLKQIWGAVTVVKGWWEDMQMVQGVNAILTSVASGVNALRDELAHSRLNDQQNRSPAAATCLWLLLVDLGMIFSSVLPPASPAMSNTSSSPTDTCIAILERLLVSLIDYPLDPALLSRPYHVDYQGEAQSTSVIKVLEQLFKCTDPHISRPAGVIKQRISATPAAPSSTDRAEATKNPAGATGEQHPSAFNGLFQLLQKPSIPKGNETFLYVPLPPPGTVAPGPITETQKEKRRRDTTLMTYTSIDNSQSLPLESQSEMGPSAPMIAATISPMATTVLPAALPSAASIPIPLDAVPARHPKRVRFGDEDKDERSEHITSSSENKVVANGEQWMPPLLSMLEVSLAADLNTIEQTQLLRLQLLSAQLQLRLTQHQLEILDKQDSARNA